MQLEDQSNTFSARGKFLITAEYAVLANVSALAVPLKLQQYLRVSVRKDRKITWMSFDDDGSLWFDLETDVDSLFGDFIYDHPIAAKLAQVLRKAVELNADGFPTYGFNASTHLDFNRHSGMGTSSTLISLVSQWLGCDPYKLQFACFGGSGYDIACATATQAIVYNYNNAVPLVTTTHLDPKIKSHLFFVYLNKKQNSRDSIARFDPSQLKEGARERLNKMSDRFKEAGNDLTTWEKLVDEHESLIGNLVALLPVKKRLFPDFKGSIKSLGGWGGDYVLASGGNEEREYFIDKGYTTIMEWDAVIL